MTEFLLGRHATQRKVLIGWCAIFKSHVTSDIRGFPSCNLVFEFHKLMHFSSLRVREETFSQILMGLIIKVHHHSRYVPLWKLLVLIVYIIIDKYWDFYDNLWQRIDCLSLREKNESLSSPSKKRSTWHRSASRRAVFKQLKNYERIAASIQDLAGI